MPTLDLTIKFHTYDVESCWVELPTNSVKSPSIIIGCVYRHPRANFEEFSAQFEEIIKEFNSKKQIVYIMGDFNKYLFQYETH
jgi:hypothetical protein